MYGAVCLQAARLQAAHRSKMGFHAARLDATAMLRQLLLQARNTVPIGSRSVRIAACMLDMPESHGIYLRAWQVLRLPWGHLLSECLPYCSAVNPAL